MAKILLPLSALLFLVLALPAFASSNKISSSTNCDENTQWKSHGVFVSCIAHMKQSSLSVSIAAKSSIGKHQDEKDGDSDDDDFTPSPPPTPPDSPSPTSEVSPSTTPSPSPTAVTVNTEIKSALGEIIQSLQALITQLQNLIAG